MGSFRVVASFAAVLLLSLTAVDAYACTCGEGPRNAFSSADLVVKGRMKAFIYGDRLPAGSSEGRPLRGAWGEVEIEKVMKGHYSQRILSVFTGTSPEDCGRVGEFLNAAVYYNDKTLGEFELGVIRAEINGRVFYLSTMCDYAKGPKFEEKPKVEEGGAE